MGPANAQDWRPEIPEPVAVGVEVVDRVTGAPIPSTELAWLPPAPAGVSRPPASGPLWIEATDGVGVFRARVPAWECLEFEARAPGYAASVSTLQSCSAPSASLGISLERPIGESWEWNRAGLARGEDP